MLLSLFNNAALYKVMYNPEQNARVVCWSSRLQRKTVLGLLGLGIKSSSIHFSHNKESKKSLISLISAPAVGELTFSASHGTPIKQPTTGILIMLAVVGSFLRMCL